MPIDKLPVRVGSPVALDPITNLPMYRKFITFEGNREVEIIKVYYQEWLESNGIKINERSKHYVVKDIEEDLLAVPPVVGSTGFTDWYNKDVIQAYVGLDIGKDLIIGSIDVRLVTLPFDAIDGYIT